MTGAVSLLKTSRSCSSPSTRQKTAVWVSGCRSAARSSKNIVAGSGPSRITGQALHSGFRFLAVQRGPRTRLSIEDCEEGDRQGDVDVVDFPRETLNKVSLSTGRWSKLPPDEIDKQTTKDSGADEWF